MKENEKEIELAFQCGECEQWFSPEEMAYGHDCEGE